MLFCGQAWGGTAYYVDLDAVSNGDGSFASPWNNIASVNSNVSGTGDDVYFKAGTEKVVSTYLNIDWVGTSEDRVIIGAYDGDGDFDITGSERPILDGNQTVPSAQWVGLINITSLGDGPAYITVQDLRINDSYFYGICVEEPDNIIVDNCYIHQSAVSGILFAETQDSEITNCTINYAGFDTNR